MNKESFFYLHHSAVSQVRKGRRGLYAMSMNYTIETPLQYPYQTANALPPGRSAVQSHPLTKWAATCRSFECQCH